MLTAAPAVMTNVEAFRPILGVLDSVLITPAELCGHWKYTEEHLCNIRKRGRGPAFIKLATGGIRYRTSEVIAAELGGTSGPLSVDRVCEALAACTGITVEARAIAQDHVRKAFSSV